MSSIDKKLVTEGELVYNRNDDTKSLILNDDGMVEIYENSKFIESKPFAKLTIEREHKSLIQEGYKLFEEEKIEEVKDSQGNEVDLDKETDELQANIEKVNQAQALKDELTDKVDQLLSEDKEVDGILTPIPDELLQPSELKPWTEDMWQECYLKMNNTVREIYNLDGDDSDYIKQQMERYNIDLELNKNNLKEIADKIAEEYANAKEKRYKQVNNLEESKDNQETKDEEWSDELYKAYYDGMYFTITRLYREKNLDEIKDYMEEYNIRDKDEIDDEDINDVTIMDIAEEIAEKYANKKEQEQKTTTKVEEAEKTEEEIKEPELEITPELEKQLTKNDIKELKDIDLNDAQKEYLAYYNISKEEIIEGLKDIANDLKYYSANEPFISIKEYIEELVNL